MKKILILLSLVMTLSLLHVPATMADPIVNGNWVQLTDYNLIDSAGIMTYNVSTNNNLSGKFMIYDTFCIQENVGIVPGIWYQVALSNAVGPNNPDHAGEGPLNGAVDYLFYQYKTGAYNTLLNNNFTNQADFQDLLWYLQGTSDPGKNYIFTTTENTPWANDLLAYNNNSSLQHSWGTEVINIFDSNGNDIQNQLYNQVPEPTTLLLLGFGLIGIAAGIRRKLKG